MYNNSNQFCMYCKAEIQGGDRIIVCPACSATHHESCWHEHKGCSTVGCVYHCQEAPAVPVEPVDPAVPVEPVAPAAPVEPVAPAVPVEPVDPAAPVESVDPAAPVEPVDPAVNDSGNACVKCGAVLAENQAFCTTCGERCAPVIEPVANAAIEQFNNNIDANKKKKKNKVLIPAVIAAAVVFLIGLIALISGPSVDSITISGSDTTLLVGKSIVNSYTIAPAKSQGKVDVVWTSSDITVATVSSSGTITAVGPGTCQITVTAKGKSDSISVKVIKGPDFKAVYNKYCESKWADVASDGSWLDIDTNPYNWDDDGVAYWDAYYAVENVIEELGLPSSLIDDIGETSYNDGRQTKYYDNVTVTWTYHPDQGLEIRFKHPS